MGVLDTLERLFSGPKEVVPASFDPQRPNFRGYDEHRMLFRVVRKSKPDKPVLEHALVLRPTRYSRAPRVRLAVHATAGGYHVDMPSGDARGLVDYIIEGTTGLWPQGRRDGKPDGMAAVHALRALFDAFLQPEIDGVPRDEYQLEFVNPDEPVSKTDAVGDCAYIVIPSQTAVETTRSATSSQLWRYTIRLSAIARLKGKERQRLKSTEKKRSLFDRALDLIGDLQDFSFDRVFAQYQQLAQPLLRIRAGLADIRRFVEGWAQGIDTFAAYNVNLLESIVGELRGIVAVFGDEYGASPSDRFGSQAQALRGVEAVQRSLERMRNAALTTPGVMFSGVSDGGSVLGARTGIRGVASPMQAANATVRLSPADQRDGRPRIARAGVDLASSLATVGPDETLEDFVPPGFSDIDFLRLNPDLVWPFIDGRRTREGAAPGPGEARVAFVGEVVRVPLGFGATAAVARGESPPAAHAIGAGRETDDELTFGRDLLVDPETRSLVLDPTTGDLTTLAGAPNLVQRLRHMLAMPVGALHYAPDIGSYVAAEAKSRWASDMQTRLLALAVQRTVLQDPGIQSVRDVEVRVENGAAHVSFEAETIRGTPLGRLTLHT